MYSVICVDITTCGNTYDMGILCKNFIADRILKLIFFIFTPVHFYQFICSERLTRYWATMILFNKRNDVINVKYVTCLRTYRVLEGQQWQRTAIKWQLHEWKLFLIFFTLPILLHLRVGNMHFVLRMFMLTHLW